MSISKKEFKEGNFSVLRGRAFEILEFFKSNKDKAYISKEIAVALKTNQVSVTPILKKLVDSGFIEKKSPYYTLADENTKTKEEPEPRLLKLSKRVPIKKAEVTEEEEFQPYDEEDDDEVQPYTEPK